MNSSSLIEKLKNFEQDLLTKKDSPIIGWTCTYIPEEIPMSFGLVPYRLKGAPIQTNNALGILPGNLNNQILSCLELALQGKYKFLDGVIIANTSDTMRRMYDAWDKYINTSFIYMLDVPKVVNKESKEYFSNILYWLIESIQKHFKIEFSENALKNSILICNETRKLLCQLYSKINSNEISLPSIFLSEITNLSASVKKSDFNKYMHTFFSQLVSKQPKSSSNNPNILVTGSCYQGNELYDVIRSAGGNVVYEDICTRARYFSDYVPINGNLVKSLSHRYLDKPPCARMVDSETRFNFLLSSIKKYNIDAVVYYALKFNDSYLFEYPLLRDWFKKREIPIIFLEGDHRFGNIEQLKTRLQAFLETL